VSSMEIILAIEHGSSEQLGVEHFSICKFVEGLIRFSIEMVMVLGLVRRSANVISLQMILVILICLHL